MSLETILSAFSTTVANDVKALRTGQGTLSALATTNKTNLVAALNELFAAINAATSIDDAVASGTSTYSSNKVIELIGLAVAGLVDSAPGTLNTLNELAAALGDDPNAITTLTTALGQRVGVIAQTFTNPEKTQARTNIDAASIASVTAVATDLGTLQTALGDVEIDINALYISLRDA